MSHEEFYMFRFFLVGDTSVGKTSLANKFCGINDVPKPTRSTQYPMQSIQLKGKNVTIKCMFSDNPKFAD
jgi:GTPase SAR1 family protein